MSKQLEFYWAQPPTPKPAGDLPPLPEEEARPNPSRAVESEPAEEVAPSLLPNRRELQEQADRLLTELGDRTGLIIQLRITNNRSTMISSRPLGDGGAVRLNLHHMFLTAPPKVRNALAQWLKRTKAQKAGETIDAFIRERRDQIHPPKPRTIYVRAQGRHFDLQPIFDEVNAAHFDNTITAHLTWGKMPTVRRRRSIRFGSYTAAHQLIRIHPLLDQEFVPRYFIRYILYHEMLHAHLGIDETPTGRRSIHPPRFKKLEKAYPDYERAKAWMDNTRNLNRLLRS